MARVTPDEFVEKHSRRLKGAVDDMRRGIERVSESPTAKAANKKDKMRSNINASIDSGKWERGLRRVPLEEWKGKMINKGLGRVATGIDEAAPKVRSFAADLLPYEDTLKAHVDKMPDTTLEDSINRATTWMRGMAKFSRKG
uniref:Uncharacterized protein n=2 Tax=viral metagenome TaxID=1070528 RepID=A0A6M3XL12_9ZZZZ